MVGPGVHVRAAGWDPSPPPLRGVIHSIAMCMCSILGSVLGCQTHIVECCRKLHQFLSCRIMGGTHEYNLVTWRPYTKLSGLCTGPRPLSQPRDVRVRLLCLVGEAVLPGDDLAGDAFVGEFLGVFVPRVARVLCAADFALLPLTGAAAEDGESASVSVFTSILVSASSGVASSTASSTAASSTSGFTCSASSSLPASSFTSSSSASSSASSSTTWSSYPYP